MMLELSPKTKQRLFERKMAREAVYKTRIMRWENKNECMITNVERVNKTFGFITQRTIKYNSMGEFNSPVYNIRASKIIRDTENMLRRFTDPVERQKILDTARNMEMREEIKDKWRAMVKRHGFFGQIG